MILNYFQIKTFQIIFLIFLYIFFVIVVILLWEIKQNFILLNILLIYHISLINKREIGLHILLIKYLLINIKIYLYFRFNNNHLFIMQID